MYADVAQRYPTVASARFLAGPLTGFFAAGHLLPVKFQFARPFPMHHQLQLQGSAQCSPIWYGQEAIALPEDFLSAGKSRMPWFAALNVSRILTDSAHSLRPKSQRCEPIDGFQYAGSRECGWGTSNRPARVWLL